MNRQEYNYLIDEKLDGSRLDKTLASCSEFSRTRIQQLIKEKNVRINGDISTDNKYITRTGDQINLQVPEPTPSHIEGVEGVLDIVFEDQYLLVINKPAGMTTHPGSGTQNDTLVHFLLHHCQGQLSGIGGVERPGIVHRLDRDTTGLIVIAKDDATHQNLSKQLQERTLKRTYHALVWGIMHSSEGVIETLIGRAKNDRKRMAVVTHSGKLARTHYKLLKLLPKASMSLVECELDTGRTHQIRVHLSHIGHSIVGDQTYGKNKRKLNRNELITPDDILSRQALHACKLEFIHPQTSQIMSFAAPLPQDFSKLLTVIDKLDHS